MGALALLGGPATEDIQVSESLARACTGTPVLVEGLLGEVGYLEEAVDAFFAGVGALAGPAACTRLRDLGMEQLHEVCTPDQIADLKYFLEDRLEEVSVPMTQRMMQIIGPGFRNRYFIDIRVAVRTMVPVPVLVGLAAPLRAGGGGGLGPYGVHRDTVFTIPRRAVTLWIALSRVQSGNTVLLWPRGGGEDITPAMAPGDVVCFTTDDPHATVENRTDETRVAIGLRVVPGRLLRFGPGDRWRPYADARLLDTPAARFAALQSKVTVANLRRVRSQRRAARRR